MRLLKSSASAGRIALPVSQVPWAGPGAGEAMTKRCGPVQEQKLVVVGRRVARLLESICQLVSDTFLAYAHLGGAVGAVGRARGAADGEIAALQ